jgi:hypothetical protein
MLTCSIQKCPSSDQNVWTIKNFNMDAPYHQQPFNVCNMHLAKEGFYQKMYESLVLGRYNQQHTSTIHYEDWTLQKVISTWKEESDYTCSQCERTDKIWKKVKWVDYPKGVYESKYVCDKHLTRKNGIIPSVICGQNGPGIATVEVTWGIELESE